MTPLSVWALLLAAIPLAAAFYYRKREVAQAVPSLLLLRILDRASPHRGAGFGRLRHRRSLLLAMAALVALVAALALRLEETTRTVDYVVVLDTSASMGAKSPGQQPTRLQEGVAMLEQLVGEREAGDRVALVSTASSSIIAAGLTEDYAGIVRRAAESSAGGDNRGIDEAFALAEALVSASSESRIVVITDGVGVTLPSSPVPVHVLRVGEAGHNLGISGLAVREADALGLAEVYLALTSDMQTETSVEVELRIDERLVDVLALDVAAHGTTEHLHRLELPPGDRLSAQLRAPPDDALALDDLASQTRDGATRVDVLLVSQASRSFAAQALQLHPRVRLHAIEPDAALPDRTWDLAVYEGAPGKPEIADARRVLAFGGPPKAFGLEGTETLSTPEIIRWTYDHPLFAFVDLRGVLLREARRLRPTPDARSLVDTNAGAVALIAAQDDRELAYFGFELEDTDFALRVGFVNLMANAVQWALTAKGADRSKAHVVPATESLIDPPQSDNASAGETRVGMAETGRGPWRRRGLLLAACGFILLESLLLLVQLARRRFRRTTS